MIPSGPQLPVVIPLRTNTAPVDSTTLRPGITWLSILVECFTTAAAALLMSASGCAAAIATGATAFATFVIPLMSFENMGAALGFEDTVTEFGRRPGDIEELIVGRGLRELQFHVVAGGDSKRTRGCSDGNDCCP